MPDDDLWLIEFDVPADFADRRDDRWLRRAGPGPLTGVRRADQERGFGGVQAAPTVRPGSGDRSPSP
jgi:hypothetical protein